MLKKICIVTGTRAEYGQLHLLMQGINNSKNYPYKFWLQELICQRIMDIQLMK